MQFTDMENRFHIFGPTFTDKLFSNPDLKFLDNFFNRRLALSSLKCTSESTLLLVTRSS